MNWKIKKMRKGREGGREGWWGKRGRGPGEADA